MGLSRTNWPFNHIWRYQESHLWSSGYKPSSLISGPQLSVYEDGGISPELDSPLLMCLSCLSASSLSSVSLVHCRQSRQWGQCIRSCSKTICYPQCTVTHTHWVRHKHKLHNKPGVLVTIKKPRDDESDLVNWDLNVHVRMSSMM